jgi:hypothetical protein
MGQRMGRGRERMDMTAIGRMEGGDSSVGKFICVLMF